VQHYVERGTCASSRLYRPALLQDTKAAQTTDCIISPRILLHSHRKKACTASFPTIDFLLIQDLRTE
jgi:hypothetical protein